MKVNMILDTEEQELVLVIPADADVRATQEAVWNAIPVAAGLFFGKFGGIVDKENNNRKHYEPWYAERFCRVFEAAYKLYRDTPTEEEKAEYMKSKEMPV